MKLYKETIVNGKKNKGYKIGGGGKLWVSFDRILIEPSENGMTAYDFYLSNYIEPTKLEKYIEQKKVENDIEQAIYKANVKTYGEITAICIRNKEIRISMKETVLPFIMGKKADAVFRTDTVNMVKKTYVYGHTYINTENGIVTDIHLIQ